MKLLVLLLFTADLALGLSKNDNLTCRPLQSNEFSRFPRSAPDVSENEESDWFSLFCDAPVMSFPEVDSIFSIFDRAFSRPGGEHSKRMVYFLKGFQEAVDRQFPRLYKAIVKAKHDSMQRLMTLLSKQSHISLVLRQYIQTTDGAANTADVCYMCRNEWPLSIMQALTNIYIQPNSSFIHSHRVVTDYGQRHMNELRVELQKIMLLLVGSSKICAEMSTSDEDGRRRQIAEIGALYDNWMRTLQVWEDDRKKALFGSLIVADYLYYKYFEKVPNAKKVRDYTADVSKEESEKQLMELAVQSSDDLGLHFNITVSILYFDWPYDRIENGKSVSLLYETRTWRVVFKRTIAYVFAVGALYEPQATSRKKDRPFPNGFLLCPADSSVGPEEIFRSMTMANYGGEEPIYQRTDGDKRYPHSFKYNVFFYVYQPNYLFYTTRSPLYQMYGVDMCHVSYYQTFLNIYQGRYIYFAAQFMDDDGKHVINMDKDRILKW
ncbi:hypothetical protein QR680_007080 [Steinernema hermaphroditum]|uniref:Peptidase M13 N-terminal domain-containing protein n=1 Tax=Steinernema hermaphroditum TaxID=289476 RepID=A0AA39LY67_9BILA|nr:hypothetical protein QR680_007080 [Steinernema hermaphroditum]